MIQNRRLVTGVEEPATPHLWRRIAGVMVSLGLIVAGAVSPAHASTSGGIALYVSGPLVQGAEISPAGTRTENFDTFDGFSPSSGGATCPTTLAIGSLAIVGRGCDYLPPGLYGGASSETGSPFFGGSGSNFFGVPFQNPGEATFTFTEPVRYVGFWWSGGNRGNVVTFYDGAAEIASLNTLELEELLGAAPPTDWPSGNGTVTSIGGTDYPKGFYFGNPRGYTEYPPQAQSLALEQDGVFYTEHRGFLYVYLNLFLTGNQTATSVKFSGPGFEYDNVTTSTLAQAPASSLVFVGGLTGKSVQFLPGADDVTGTMVAQSSTGAANLSQNAFSRDGFVFTGWSTQQDGGAGGVAYDPEAEYDFSADLILYAQWEEAPSDEDTSTTPVTSRTASSSPSVEPISDQPTLAQTGGSSHWLTVFAGVAVMATGMLLLSRRRVVRDSGNN